MFVFGLLDQQLEKLLADGQTDPVVFRKSLQSCKLLSATPQIPDVYTDVHTFQQEVRQSATGNILSVKGTGFSFEAETLSRLGGTEWFNDDLIIFCLHLADRLSYVRVGFCVPLHKQAKPQAKVVRPFERTSQVIKEWNAAEPHENLVCFFPLCHHGTHFSLLEVNQRDKTMYHYDSIKTDRPYIKKACETQFPEFKYTVQIAHASWIPPAVALWSL
ncbi:hypothetical protein F5Y03DRAFT_79342 [Xylaria venustula]|nr:hypothetical protein F5Y03DRAFT_79342 [Xylaria venustula]